MVEPADAWLLGRQPVPRQQEVGRKAGRRLQAGELIREYLQGQSGIEQRIVAAIAEQATVLVVLDQVVIRIARKRQRIEAQCVDRILAQQAQIGLDGAQLGQIEGDQIVTQEIPGAVGQIVERAQGIGQRTGRKRN